MKKVKELSIDENGRVFLDGEELPNVTGYKLKNSACGTAELTVTMLVKVDRVGFGSK